MSKSSNSEDDDRVVEPPITPSRALRSALAPYTFSSSPIVDSSSSSSRSTASRPPEQGTVQASVPYYQGLPSRPELLASTSTRTFIPLPIGHPIPKHLFPIQSHHSIVWLWERIASHAKGIVDNRIPLGDLTLDAIRIGYNEVEAQTTIWIGTSSKTTSAETASYIVAAIKEFGVQQGASEFEVELHTTTVYRCSKLLDPRETNLVTPELTDPYSWSVGIPISPAKHPDYLGTAGLLLKLPDNENLFLLSAHHVVDADYDSRLLPSTTTNSSDIRLATPVTYREDMTKAADFIENCAYVVQTHTRKIAFARSRGRDEDIHVKLLPLAEYRLQMAQNWSQQLSNDYASESFRTIGRTFAYPAVAFNVDPNTSDPNAVTGFTEDWCLIATDLDRDAVPMNLLSLLVDKDINLARARPERHPPLANLNHEDYTNLLPVEGFLTSTELDTQSYTVLMRGAVSGLTLGTTNFVKSYVRQRHCWSLEIGIIGSDGDFSKPGDSGSSVIDRSGKVCGLLTSGHGNEVAVMGDDGITTKPKIDVSYVTPFWWLLERMRVFGLDATLV